MIGLFLKYWYKIGFLIIPDLYKKQFFQNPWYLKLYHSYDIVKQKKAYKINRKNKGVIEALENVFQNVDSYINKSCGHKKTTITCKKGCSFCCSKEVFISDDEAKVLYNHISVNELKVDLGKATYQAASKFNLPLHYRECIFLDTETKECRVYDIRPLSCRMLLASSDPEFCLGNKPSKPLYYLLPKMENTKTAIWNSSISGILPAMILKQFNKK